MFSEPTRKIVRFCELARDFDCHGEDRKFRHEGIVSSSTNMFSFGVVLLAAAREEEGMSRVLFIQMKGTNGWGSFYSNYWFLY